MAHSLARHAGGQRVGKKARDARRQRTGIDAPQQPVDVVRILQGAFGAKYTPLDPPSNAPLPCEQPCSHGRLR